MAREPAKMPAIPALTEISDPAIRKVLEAVKETLEIRNNTRPRTSKLDANITYRDLINYGIDGFYVDDERVSLGSAISKGVASSLVADGADGKSAYEIAVENGFVGTEAEWLAQTTVDLGTPPTITGLEATGTQTGVLIEWDNIIANPRFGYAEIWRADVNNLANAVLHGTSDGFVYPDLVGRTGATFYYWVRAISKFDVVGDFNGVSGTVATTGGATSDDVLASDDAKFLNLTAAHANVYSLSASKITTGRLLASNYIAVGTGADAIIIDGLGNIRAGATGYATGTGIWSGIDGGVYKSFMGNSQYSIKWDGSALDITGNIRNGQTTFDSGIGLFSGVHEGTYKLSFGNSDGNKVTHDGVYLNINSENLVLTDTSLTINGSGTFSGELNAASGTFAGNLLAGVLDFSELDGERFSFIVAGDYTVTVPENKTNMRITCVGGGGGGGSARSGGGGGGGGSGYVVTATFSGLTPYDVYSLTVGERGVGASSGTEFPTTQNGYKGGDGSASFVTGLVTANGGIGGNGGISANYASYVGIGTRGGGLYSSSGGLGGDGGVDGSDGVAGIYESYEGDNYLEQDGTGGIGGAGLSKGGKGGEGGVNTPVTSPMADGSDGEDGYILIEFFNPNSVVLQTTYNTLISALQAQGIDTE